MGTIKSNKNLTFIRLPVNSPGYSNIVFTNVANPELLATVNPPQVGSDVHEPTLIVDGLEKSTDASALGAQLVFLEVVMVYEEMVRAQAVIEASAVNEDIVLQVEKVVSETTTVTEFFYLTYTNNLLDALNITESFDIAVGQVHLEALAIQETLYMSFTKELSDSVTVIEILEELTVGNNKVFLESVAINEFGTIANQSYASEDYFAEDYSGTLTAF